MSKALLIKTKAEGCMQIVEFPESGDRLGFYYEAINCSTIDIVPAYGLEDIGIRGYDLVIDDEGLVTGKHINGLASLLYGFHSHGQIIVGDVLLCKRVETPDGIDTAGFENPAELEKVLEGLDSLVKQHNEEAEGGKEK